MIVVVVVNLMIVLPAVRHTHSPPPPPATLGPPASGRAYFDYQEFEPSLHAYSPSDYYPATIGRPSADAGNIRDRLLQVSGHIVDPGTSGE
jgi:hypothetical protein